MDLYQLNIGVLGALQAMASQYVQLSSGLIIRSMMKLRVSYIPSTLSPSNSLEIV
jgi:hypothetical protein